MSSYVFIDGLWHENLVRPETSDEEDAGHVIQYILTESPPTSRSYKVIYFNPGHRYSENAECLDTACDYHDRYSCSQLN